MSFATVVPDSPLIRKPKTQVEGLVKYSTKNSYFLGDIYVPLANNCEFTASDESIPPGDSSYVLFIQASRPMGSNDITVNVIGYDSSSGAKNGSALLKGYTAVDAAVPIGSAASNWGGIIGTTVSGGNAGDLFEVWAVPDADPDNYHRLRYVRSYEVNSAPYMQPVPDVYDPAYVQISARRGYTISLGKDYVNYTDVTLVAGREVTMFIEVHPDGTGIISEYIILPKAYINVDQSAGEGAIVVNSASGGFANALFYTVGA